MKHGHVQREWRSCSLEDLCEVYGGGTPSTSKQEYWDGDIPWITSADIGDDHVIRPRKAVTQKGVVDSATHVVPAGSLVIATRVSLGKVGIADEPVCYSQDCQGLVIDPDALHPRYLLHHLSLLARDFLGMSRGTTINGITKKQLLETVLSVPPLVLQHRIVAKIEELFSDLDAGVAALERVQANLKRYRASVLKAAVEGRLTAEWREENPNTEPASELLKRILVERRRKWEEAEWQKQIQRAQKKAAKKRLNVRRVSDLDPEDWQSIPEPEYTPYLPKNDKWKAKYKEPTPPDTTDLPELLAGWKWTTLSQIGFLDRGKSKHRPRNAPHLFGGPYPFIQTGDVRHASTFVRSYEQTYSEAGLAQSRLWPAGTLCITIAANIAETALLGMDACFPDSVVGWLGASNRVSERYVELYLRTMQHSLEALAPATAQKNINLQTLHAVAVALPPLAEQHQIVAEVDRRLSVVDELEEQVDANLKRAARLRQAILKRAFEGELF